MDSSLASYDPQQLAPNGPDIALILERSAPAEPEDEKDLCDDPLPPLYRVVSKSPPPPGLASILVKYGEQSKPETRKDFYGTQIVRNSKTHKITFRDAIPDKPVFDVLYIESYKEYNVLPKESPKAAGCSCTIM
ncbi:MAG: hypothetical protein P4M11_10860 [Candidatus Pacebacteria bacterium]|nr:hypothetical protein [Candidatus Paceibacterota bacterium]